MTLVTALPVKGAASGTMHHAIAIAAYLRRVRRVDPDDLTPSLGSLGAEQFPDKLVKPALLSAI